ncbi:hypothetical protein [Glaciibacter psychrotolerans]|uniref:Uncharacterized protein n=1 Tax=Glaciibacter psychrotolerans TaxID=670054 RepID=A0A7Z0EBS8_9MICO|nr:hypothetical protein [Leifsonia psychrotolerans]NYJ18613.1 hypothetical protein [Leifsonia psychrotolerans]
MDRTVALKLTDSRVPGRRPAAYLATMTSSGSTIRKTDLLDGADAEVHSTTRAWKGLIIGGVDLDTADGITLTGDAEAVHALVGATKL